MFLLIFNIPHIYGTDRIKQYDKAPVSMLQQLLKDFLEHPDMKMIRRNYMKTKRHLLSFVSTFNPQINTSASKNLGNKNSKMNFDTMKQNTKLEIDLLSSNMISNISINQLIRLREGLLVKQELQNKITELIKLCIKLKTVIMKEKALKENQKLMETLYQIVKNKVKEGIADRSDENNIHAKLQRITNVEMKNNYSEKNNFIKHILSRSMNRIAEHDLLNIVIELNFYNLTAKDIIKNSIELQLSKIEHQIKHQEYIASLVPRCKLGLSKSPYSTFNSNSELHLSVGISAKQIDDTNMNNIKHTTACVKYRQQIDQMKFDADKLFNDRLNVISDINTIEQNDIPAAEEKLETSKRKNEKGDGDIEQLTRDAEELINQRNKLTDKRAELQSINLQLISLSGYFEYIIGFDPIKQFLR